MQPPDGRKRPRAEDRRSEQSAGRRRSSTPDPAAAARDSGRWKASARSRSTSRPIGAGDHVPQPRRAAASWRRSVIDQRRLDAAAWGLALLVLLVGVGLTRRPARGKATYVIVVLLASTVPLLAHRRPSTKSPRFSTTSSTPAACLIAVLPGRRGRRCAAYRWVKSRAAGRLLQPAGAADRRAARRSAARLGNSGCRTAGDSARRRAARTEDI